MISHPQEDDTATIREDDMDDQKIEQMRRYENFSTVDWVQDSLHERTIQAKKGTFDTLRPHVGISVRMQSIGGLVGWIWESGETILEEGQDWLVVGLVGMGIGLNAAFIVIVTEWLSSSRLGHCTSGWWLNEKFCCLEADVEGEETCPEWHDWGGGDPLAWVIYVTCAIAYAFVAARIVKSFAPYAAGSGISEIKCILGGFIIKGFLGFWTLIIKSLALPLAIASGLSVGKEGPSVHVACCVGNVVAGFFSRFAASHTKMREVLTAASAAGVAVAFGSPIGGVLFAIEEMSHNFTNRTMWRSFVCALVATVTLSAMNPYRTGELVLFQVSYDRNWHYFELPWYILIGLFGGLYGAFVVKYNLQMAAFRRKHLLNHGIAEAVTLAAITALVGYMNKFLRIDMTESMSILFKECEGGGDYDNLCQTWAQWRNVNTLLLATVVRTGMVVLSYGCKVPAGIFVPSMAVGASFGRMVGIISKAIQAANPESSYFLACQPDVPCITPGTYAFLGAAAALTGVTRMTVTVVVIMFELTGALTYILPTMIVVLVAKAVSDSFGEGGIADQMIKFNGYPFLEKEDPEGNDEAFLQPISHIMKKDIITMRGDGMTWAEIDDIMENTSVQGFPVVRNEDDNTLLGYIRRAELRFALDKAKRVRNLSPQAICTFRQMEAPSPSELHELTRPSTDGSVNQWGDFGFDDEEVEGFESRTINAAEQGGERRREQVDFGNFVDQTPLCVSPKQPLEIVMQLFRRMGPRIILVGHQGRLAGLVTVKDVLYHEAEMEHEQASRLPEEQHAEDRVGLEGVLDEAWLWASNLFNFSSLSSSTGPNGPGELDPGRMESSAFEYELNEHRQSSMEEVRTHTVGHPH
ncbi:voltage-gated chloride channel [Phaffia rhodozyma]|uniref:Chloride channel protein n=1 Tax=Phaffia rhodozyma TaxID=264483 RepID=A0A0F7SJB9_PHARH|nr:voltage-gated chloride channel [Phaffia rhodozyma]